MAGVLKGAAALDPQALLKNGRLATRVPMIGSVLSGPASTQRLWHRVIFVANNDDFQLYVIPKAIDFGATRTTISYRLLTFSNGK